MIFSQLVKTILSNVTNFTIYFSFIHGKGEAIRNFIYVSDVANAFDVIMHNGKPGETYNVGTDTEISVMELATTLIKKVILVK